MENTTNPYWWHLALKGLLAIILGLGIWWFPALSLISLVMFCGVVALVGGMLLMIGAARKARSGRIWKDWLVEGIIDSAIGLLLLVFPRVSVSVFLVLLAAWAIFMGVLYARNAWIFRNQIGPKWTWMLGGGVLSVIFGLSLVAFPFKAGVALTALIGIFAFLAGTALVIYAFHLRKRPPMFRSSHTDKAIFIE